MLVILFILLFTALFSYLWSLLSLGSLWFIFLYVFLGFVSSLIFTIICVLIIILIFTKSKYDNKVNHRILWHILKFVIIVLRIKIDVEGLENIPNETFVVYGNHKSNCDVIIVYLVYKRVMSAVAKKELAQVPVLKTIMKAFEVVPVDRENNREGAKAIIKASRLVKDGLPMIIFPEGGVKTREVETMVNLRAGAYQLATRAEATISPVSIIGSSHISKNFPWKKTKVKVLIHKPITYLEYQDKNTHEIGEEVMKIIDKGVVTGKLED